MHKNFFRAIAVGGAFISLSGCSYFELEKLEDPNNPTLESATDNPSKQKLDQLSTGVFSDLRTNVDGIVWYHQIAGIIGREVYVLSTSDARYVNEPLGTGPFSNNDFLSTRYFTTYSSARRTARILGQAAANSQLISAEQKNAYTALAKTAEAYAMLVLSDLQYENGLRIDVADPTKPGKIKPYPEVLGAIKALLDDAATLLGQSGTSLPFPVPAGFRTAALTGGSTFSTSANFLKFNRALAARLGVRLANVSGGSYSYALAAANASFKDIAGPLTAGPRFEYGVTRPDVVNPLFTVANSNGGTVTVANPRFLSEIRTGDTRRSKVRSRTSISRFGITSNSEPALYASNGDPIPVIKNEELILIAAEAHAKLGDIPQAIVEINSVARGYGLTYAPTNPTVDDVIDEILYQRRYSLFFEGQRWVDLRRLGKLDNLNVGATGKTETVNGVQSTILTSLPLPFAEVTWDASNP